MDEKVLVTYASKYGATAEIAAKIGQVLSQAGLQADITPVNNVHDVNAYRAVILGSALYIGKWQKEAEVFVKANEQILSQRPFWVFSSGPTGKVDSLELVEGQRLPSTLKPVIDRIRPRDVTVFHGHINPDKLNFIEKFAIKNLVKKPFGDFRDWQIITAWANQIVDDLKVAV